MKISALPLLVLGVVLGIVPVNAAAKHRNHQRAVPEVILPYGVYQATENSTGAYYNFTNIRYAEPPIGDLRFQAPIPPLGLDSTINDDQDTLIVCSQGAPEWILELEAEELGINVSTLIGELSGVATTEDCLFLDVFVPESIFPASIFDLPSKPAPVLVWIYGGGYTLGWKSQYDPAGLIAQSLANGGEGMIVVAMNYRLGMFGFMSGSEYQGEGGTGNAGLWDQRLALEWVQTYIPLFGGDPDRVTIMGESAGGGSVLHQITAFGGLSNTLFQQAVPQSPAYLPIANSTTEDNIFNTVLGYASLIAGTEITSLSDLNTLTTEVLQEINELAVLEAPYGQFFFGPSVDGDFVPALPGVLLAEGKFDASVKIMVGHNSDEGALFTPAITNETGFDEYVRTYQLPRASNETIEYVENVLYPPIFDGSYPYVTQDERLALLIAEAVITCNTRYMNLAYKNQTYAYLFDIPPGVHGEDLDYTFYNGATSTLDDEYPINGTTAIAFQDYIVAFVVSGNPNGDGRPDFPIYGSSATVLDIDYTLDGETQVDPVDTSRCTWWQLGIGQ